MTLLTFEEAALRELEEAALWYAEQGEELPDRLLAEFTDVQRRIEQWPDAFPLVIIAGCNHTIRRARLDRFPYAIVYLQMVQEVRVLAFMHQRRRPLYWIFRISGET